MYSSPHRAGWPNQLQADLSEVLTRDGHRRSLEDAILERLTGEAETPEASHRLCVVLTELVSLLTGRSTVVTSMADAHRSVAETSIGDDRQAYRVLIGSVSTREGSITVGGTALLGVKDGERLTARNIVEPMRVKLQFGSESAGAHHAAVQDPELRHAVVTALTGMLGGPTGPMDTSASNHVYDLAQTTQPLVADQVNGSGSADLEVKSSVLPADTDDSTVLNPDQRQARILAEIAKLDPAVESNWLKSGAPDVKALEAVLSFHITAAERDAAWEQHQVLVAINQGNE